MKELNPIIIRFIREQLSAEIKFDNLEQRGWFSKTPIEFIKPFPFVFFVPYTILFMQQNLDLLKLQQSLEKSKEGKYKNIRYDYQRKELNLRVHS
jgi:hypothetical protein